MTDYEDYPLEELQESAGEWGAKGADVYLKWTCEACGERIMLDTPNVFTYQAQHTDCPSGKDYITNLKEKGANYLVIHFNKRMGGHA